MKAIEFYGKITNNTMQGNDIIHTNDEIANHAINYRVKKNIKIPDALILATARYLNADFLTENKNDFTGIDPFVKILSLKEI